MKGISWDFDSTCKKEFEGLRVSYKEPLESTYGNENKKISSINLNGKASDSESNSTTRGRSLTIDTEISEADVPISPENECFERERSYSSLDSAPLQRGRFSIDKPTETRKLSFISF